MNAFSKYHPLVIFFSYTFLIIYQLLSFNPILIAIGLIFSVAYIFLILGKSSGFKHIKYNLIFILIATVINGLFVHMGKTQLLFINGNALTFESLMYGLSFSCNMCCVFNLFACFSKQFDSQKVMYLFGKISRNLALIFTMALKFIPDITACFARVKNAKKAIGKFNTTNFFVTIKSYLSCFLTVISLTFESAITKSKSMQLKGFNSGKASVFNAYKFKLVDLIVLIINLVIFVMAIFTVTSRSLEFNYYIEIDSICFSPLCLIGYFIKILSLSVIVYIECRERVLCQL